MTQEQALNILKTGAPVFLTGEPGSGKTHVIREYIRYLVRAKISVAVTASTGIAATHLNGVTINSWSGIGVKKVLSRYDLDYITSNERVVRRIRQTKVLIIDEVSMLDGSTLNSIDRVCRAVKQLQEPFGGMQIVLVGDFFQLPPVARFGEPDAQFAFNSSAWESAKFFVCYLSEQHRQNDQAFLDVLSAVRRAAVTAEHTAHLDGRCMALNPEMEKSATRLFSHNVDVDQVNSAELKKIPGEMKTYKMESAGRRLLIEQIKRGCLSPENLVLKKGAVVMFTKNSPKGLFVNGTLGKVEDFNEFTGLPIIRTKDGKKIEAEKMEWAIDDNGRVLARVSQIPLRLAWAITVHKSQGMSLDAAYIDLRSAFVAGQGYVALSRVRTLAGVFLAGYNQKSLLVHPEVLERDNEFRARSADVAAAFARQSPEEMGKMHANFIRVMGGQIYASKKDNNDNAEKKYSLEKIREKHANAYSSWKPSDEILVTEWFKNGLSVKDMANILGRKTGAITARLKKLGLIE